MTISELQKEAYYNAFKHGFYDEPESDAGRIALIHGEASEALEALRKIPFPKDEHCPKFDNFIIELADIVIRVADFSEAKGYDLEAAIIAKHEFNKTRPYLHGKKF